MMYQSDNTDIKKFIPILNMVDSEVLEYIREFTEIELMNFCEFLEFYVRVKNIDNSVYKRSKHIRTVLIEQEIKNRQSSDLNESDMSLRPTINLSLDNDGNILLTKREHVDFSTIYSNSHELLKIYEKTNNIVGIKYELCKLWMCKTLIDNNILYNTGIRSKLVSENKRKKASATKSFIMADIKKYLISINEKEPGFNFQEYFNKTQFGIEVYKIDNRVIKASKLLFGAFK